MREQGVSGGRHARLALLARSGQPPLFTDPAAHLQLAQVPPAAAATLQTQPSRMPTGESELSPSPAACPGPTSSGGGLTTAPQPTNRSSVQISL